VRTGLVRTTLHLVGADDALALNPLFAPVLARTLRSQRQFRVGLDGLDLHEVARLATEHLTRDPMTASQLRPILGARWPERDPAHLMMAVRYLVPIVQVPPRGLFRRTRQPTLTTFEAWLGVPPLSLGNVEGLIERYLRAFGPATVSDLRTWSWLTGLAAVVERIRDRLRSYRDDAGRELLDVADGEIIDGGEPAPVRFLPEFDNVFLSHADRSRIVEGPLDLERYARGTLLVDGFVAGGWRVVQSRREARLLVFPARPLDAAERRDVVDEATSLLAFLTPDATSRAIEGA
jgi:hypothetical protein